MSIEKKFKCCRKDFNNFVCINCYGIFHTSCLHRTKKPTEVDGYKIYCSLKCEKVSNEKYLELQKLNDEVRKLKDIITENNDKSEIAEIDYNSNIETLGEEIVKLKKDIERREEHYNKERKIRRDLEDEALEMEQRFLKEIKILTERNNIVTESLQDLMNKMEDMRSQLSTTSNELKRQQVDNLELLEINKQMVNSIRLLESENEYMNVKLSEKNNVTSTKEAPEIRILENLIVKSPDSRRRPNPTDLEKIDPSATPKNDDGEATVHIDQTDTITEKNIEKPKNKLLIVGDETMKNLPGYLHNLVNNKYICEGLTMPNVELATLSKCVFNLSINYGKNDIIIFSFKTSNVSNFNSLYNSLNNILPLSKFTNLIIISKKSSKNDAKIEREILSRIFSHNKGSRNIPVNYYSNIRNIRGFTRRVLIPTLPKILERGLKHIVLKSVQYNSVNIPFDTQVVEINGSSSIIPKKIFGINSKNTQTSIVNNKDSIATFSQSTLFCSKSKNSTTPSTNFLSPVQSRTCLT